MRICGIDEPSTPPLPSQKFDVAAAMKEATANLNHNGTQPIDDEVICFIADDLWACRVYGDGGRGYHL